MTPDVVVASTPRAGGNWLLRLLADAGLLGGGEWLTPANRERGYRKLTAARKHDRPYVVKVHPDELWTYDMTLADVTPGDRPVRYVHLTRQDRDAQAESYAGALATGRWFDGSTRGITTDPRLVDALAEMNTWWAEHLPAGSYRDHLRRDPGGADGARPSDHGMGTGMRVTAIMMVRNESDIIEPILLHTLAQVDDVIVADNNSDDGTRDILERVAADAPVTIVDDPEVGYLQAEKMTALAGRARDAGADWVVPVDADEWWYCPHAATVAEFLRGLDRIDVVEATMYDHVATAADPGDWSNPTTRIGWRRRAAGKLPKVACRTAPDLRIEQGNHGATYSGRARWRDGLVIRHFPYRTPEQFVAKARQGAAALAATNLPESSGAHWRQYAALAEANGDDALHDVFREWFWSADPVNDPTLIYDPAPMP